MGGKGNFTKEADGTIIYKTVSKTGSPPVELDSSKWYMDKCGIVGYRGEHLTIKINQDGIIRVDGNYNDGKASRSFFNEYIIPDGVNYEALEFCIYDADQNTLVILGSFGSGEEMVSANQAVATKTETSTAIKRTENVRISSTFTETFESTELEGSEDMSKEIRIVDNKFEAKVNVSEYKSEEVHVKISKKVVLIYTSRKEVTTSTRREIKKTFEIPAGVEPKSITSVFGQDGNLTISATVDDELARQQRQIQETNKTTITTISSTDEVLIRTRTVNTTKNVTGQDLKEVKINKDRFEMNVDLREYKLEEITVKIIKSRRVITISANHKSQFESRSTNREFMLPAGTPDSNPNVIDAVLSSNGILTITGPCTPQTLPAALTNVTDKQQQQNTCVQQQQQNTSVQQQQQNTSVQQRQNTSVQKQESIQQVQETSVQQQTQQQIIQKSQYTKITRETFTSNTMTSLDIVESDGDGEEPLSSEPDTLIEDLTPELLEDEDGNSIIELNVKNYRAEDIMVKASKSTITITLRKNEDIKQSRTIIKKIHVPADVVVTPDTIRSIFDKPKGTLIIIIRKKSVTTTETQQITDNTTEQTKTQQQINQQKQVQQKQESVQTRQQDQRQQVQQNQETVEETQTKTQQQINQQRQVQENQESVQRRQQVQQQDQRQQNTTTTTSKRTIKTTTTTVETLKTLGYNFDSATTQEYKGDPKFFERATPVIDYKPEELEVKIAMPWVIVEGKQEMTAENGWRSKQFTKMFTVPEGVKQENIHLELNDAGDVVNCTALIG